MIPTPTVERFSRAVQNLDGRATTKDSLGVRTEGAGSARQVIQFTRNAVRETSRGNRCKICTSSTPGGQFIVYEVKGSEARVDVRFNRQTDSQTQRQVAGLFEASTDNVSVHLNNVFGTQEIELAATTEAFSVVRTEGSRQVRRNPAHYDPGAIISVGYRVDSRRGVRFRQWATRTLPQHLVSRFTLNERRLAELGHDIAL